MGGFGGTAKHILTGALRALSGPEQPDAYQVDQTGNMRPAWRDQSGALQGTPPPGHDFRRIFGGILGGALTGLAGGVEAQSRPGGPRGPMAAIAGGYEAETNRLREDDFLKRQQAMQRFQMAQAGERLQLEKQRETNEQDYRRGQLALESVRNLHLAHIQDFEEQNAYYKRTIEADKKLGFVTTLAPDIKNNGVAGNAESIIAQVNANPKAFMPTDEHPYRVYIHSGKTQYVFDRVPDPNAPKEYTNAQLAGIFPHMDFDKADPKGTLRLDEKEKLALRTEEQGRVLEEAKMANAVKVAKIEAASRELSARISAASRTGGTVDTQTGIGLLREMGVGEDVLKSIERQHPEFIPAKTFAQFRMVRPQTKETTRVAEPTGIVQRTLSGLGMGTPAVTKTTVGPVAAHAAEGAKQAVLVDGKIVGYTTDGKTMTPVE